MSSLRTFNLRPIQVPMVEWMWSLPRCAAWMPMGSGKTSGVLYALDTLRIAGEIGSEPTLVIGPMRVARDTWPEEVAKWEQFKNLRVIPITGTPERRRQKLKARADIYTVSYELSPWLVSHYMAKWPFRIVIADEADRLKGLRGKQHNMKGEKHGASGMRAFQLARVAHSMVRRWVNLAGTPIGNAGYADLWGQTWYLDRGQRLGETYGKFQSKWFQRKWSGWGSEIMPHSKAEIDKVLADICLSVDPADYFNLDKPVVRPVYVNLPEKARAVYKDLESQMFAEIEEFGDLHVFNSASLTNKCLQIAGGAVYTEYPQWVPMHDEKLDALESILHEAGGLPIMVQYNFKHEAARIQSRFPKAVDISKLKGLQAFKAGDAPIGYAHAKSMGHGIDGLQDVTNILVRFGHDWNIRDRLQMLERIGPMRQMQSGYKRPVFVYDILAKNTVDMDVLKVHETGISVLESLMQAMKGQRDALHQT